MKISSTIFLNHFSVHQGKQVFIRASFRLSLNPFSLVSVKLFLWLFSVCVHCDCLRTVFGWGHQSVCPAFVPIPAPQHQSARLLSTSWSQGLCRTPPTPPLAHAGAFSLCAFAQVLLCTNPASCEAAAHLCAHRWSPRRWRHRKSRSFEPLTSGLCG